MWMELFEDVEQEKDHRRRAANFNVQLKNHILNIRPVTTADVMDLEGKSFDAFDMTMSGIQIATTIHDALTLAQWMRLVDEVSKDGQAVRTGIRGAQRFMFRLEALGPLATYTSFWIDLAGAWPEAKAKILKDSAAQGLSAGIVLGANDAIPSYVGGHFWQQARESYPSYREVEAPAKNMHNAALVAGYGQAKNLTRIQKGRFLTYLHSKMSEGDRSYYFSVNFKDWGPTTKRDYYNTCSALFRKHHLQ